MSLINEALKRAKEAQNQTASGGPAAPGRGLELRPAEPQSNAGSNRFLLLPIILTLLAVAGLVALWELRFQNSRSALVVAAAGKPATIPNPGHDSTTPAPGGPVNRAESVAEPPAATGAKATPSSAAHALESASVPGATPAAAGTVTNAAPAASAAAAPAASTNATLAGEPQPTRPVLRLQAILFTANDPSAMINGKTVRTGDKFGELRVLAINRSSATLIGPAGTNVLTFAE